MKEDTPADFSDVAVVTVSTRNYLHRVRALFTSVGEFMPGALKLTCCVDTLNGVLDPEGEDYEIFEASELGIPRFEQLMLALNPTAVCCALKPYAVMRALQHNGIKKVIYIDNDIGLYRTPAEMLESLSRHSFVLTPHHLAPLPKGASPDEMVQVPYGIYNAGMFAVSNTSEAIAFLEWWADWMTDPRHLVPDWGYDQIWLNYVPVYCQNASILHEKGYNVAFWNFAERDLGQKGDAYFCGDAPLVAFHFSHFDDRQPERIVPNYIESNVIESDTTRALGKLIAEAWSSHGRDRCLEWGYQYKAWHDGIDVSDSEREYVRKNWDDISPELDLWSASLQAQEPELYKEMRAAWLSEKKGDNCKSHSLVSNLLDFSPRKVLKRIQRCMGNK